MSGGYKKIHKHKNAGKSTFADRPEDINRKGRPVVRPIKEMLREISEKEGKLTFPISKCKILKDKVVVTIPSMEMLAYVAMKKASEGDVRWFQEVMKLMGAYEAQKVDHSVTYGGFIDQFKKGNVE